MSGLESDPITVKQTEKRKAEDAFTEDANLPSGEATDARRSRSDKHASEAPSTTSLPGLLDCSSLKDQVAIEARFHLIARSLLCEHVLVVKPAGNASEIEYELLEVEFYLLSAGCHEDAFTHGAEEQRVSGKWYFHKPPWLAGTSSGAAGATMSSPSNSRGGGDTQPGGYRGGTRKGLDLTMGGPLQVLSPHFPQTVVAPAAASSSSSSSKKAGPRGGVLFRSMRRVGGTSLSAMPVISGPSLLVDELLRACGGVASILELVEGKLGGDTNAFLASSSSNSQASSCKKDGVQLYLRPRSKRVETSIYTSPRIGLELSNPVTKASYSDPRVVFVRKLYRFFVRPTLLTANGRVQTFLGVYSSVSSSPSQRNKGQILAEVARITGIKRPTVDKYAEEFRRGKEEGKLKEFVGAAGKGVCSKPALYLKMMGTLAAARQ